MKSIDEKGRYIREKIADEKGFHLLGQDSESKYRFKVEAEGHFEYAPSVVFLFDEEFVANASSRKLARFVNKAIFRAVEVLRDPPSTKRNLQGWIKIIESVVIFIPYILPATKMQE